MPFEILLANAAFTWALLGVIWIVQLVQYPGFRKVGEVEWNQYHESHCARIAWVVAPLMICELLTGIALVWSPVPGVNPLFFQFGLGLIVLAWLSTAFLSVPLHHKLKRYDPSAQKWLILTNWVRTCVWTIRGVGCFYAVRQWVSESFG